VAGATVHALRSCFGGKESVTGRDGRYEIADLIPGEYDVSLESEEARLQDIPERKVTVAEGATVEMNFNLE
jgi:hypothetical protein